MHANRDSHALSWSLGQASSFVQRALLREPPRVPVFLTLALPAFLEVDAARCCHVLSEVFDAPYHAISSSPSEMGWQAIYMLYANPAWHTRKHVLSVGCADTVVCSRTIGLVQCLFSYHVCSRGLGDKSVVVQVCFRTIRKIVQKSMCRAMSVLVE